MDKYRIAKDPEVAKLPGFKRITIEIPESAYMMDMVYYWKHADGVVKANGVFDADDLTDGNILKAWSNRFTKTEAKE